MPFCPPQAYKDRPIVAKNSAPHSGAVAWVRGLMERIDEPMQKLRTMNKQASWCVSVCVCGGGIQGIQPRELGGPGRGGKHGCVWELRVRDAWGDGAGWEPAPAPTRLPVFIMCVLIMHVLSPCLQVLEMDMAKEIMKTYDTLMAQMTEYQGKQVAAWCERVAATSDEKLNQALLKEV